MKTWALAFKAHEDLGHPGSPSARRPPLEGARAMLQGQHLLLSTLALGCDTIPPRLHSATHLVVAHHAFALYALSPRSNQPAREDVLCPQAGQRRPYFGHALHAG